MSNKGVTPVDPLTPVGEFRLLYGDTEYKPLCPEEPGYGDYEDFSDDEIRAFLGLADQDLTSAISLAYLQLAKAAAKEAKSVQDLDLRISTEKRATELRALAQMWSDRAREASADVFELFDTVVETPCPPPELAPRPYARGGLYGCSIL